MSALTKTSLKRGLSRAIEALSFDGQVKELAEFLNRRVSDNQKGGFDLLSHPGGVTRAFYKRRIGIAESYVEVAKQLTRNNHRGRLDALKTLMELSLHAKTVSMPLNTARVQIELMKEAIKNSNHRRLQREAMADFSLASYGHEAVVRRFLRELELVEVPEEGKPLRELDMGWDSHVHDTLSEGRKTPSQVVLDAFIKGLSRVTLVYYDLANRKVLYESIEAGRILGIEVRVGVEFSVGPASMRRHFIFLPPCESYESLVEYLDAHRDGLEEFWKGVGENRRRRRKAITRLLDEFNSHRAALNRGFDADPKLLLPPLEIGDLIRYVRFGQFSRMHLGELLFEKLSKVLRRRILYLKTQLQVTRDLEREGGAERWEVERLEEAYRGSRREYARLNPDSLRQRYFADRGFVDYDSVFEAERDVLPRLKKEGGQVVYVHPLTQGLSKTMETVLSHPESIDCIELVNNYDNAGRNPEEIDGLSRFVAKLNGEDLDELLSFVRSEGGATLDDDQIAKAHDLIKSAPLTPLAASDSTGRRSNAPGMGFIRECRIPKKTRRHYLKNHYRLPALASRLIVGGGRLADASTPNKKPTSRDKKHRKRKENSETKSIVAMGKRDEPKLNKVGDEERVKIVGLRSFWRYANPKLKAFARVGVGLVPAYLWVGALYTGIWFGITLIRNVLVDLIAANGMRTSDWRAKDINVQNATQSLLWTGFSVPILGLVKLGFDRYWPFLN